METFKKFIQDLGVRNREFYGTTDGMATLRALELAFDHSWIYLCELLQNAIDAGASSLKIDIAESGDALVFQHNGDNLLDKDDIEGLSKVFRSTKGARSVGFMGIGFKSVFKRFQEVWISDVGGWKFKFEISQVVGDEYGDVQQNLLGAVIPIWDDGIICPDDDFTTRFELRRRTNKDTSLYDDLQQFLPDEDRSVLAIFAMSGLRHLEINEKKWDLDVCKESDGSHEATALSEKEDLLWRIFSANFEPSKEAIASFLEHRKIQPLEKDKAQVYGDAARVRQVLGVLPLDNHGNPLPPGRGRVYATLPTDVTLPFGLHINADWLLNISRGGLREIENNPWQSEIINEIANLLAQVLKWSAKTNFDPEVAKSTFKVLSKPSSEAGGLDAFLADEHWLSILRNHINQSAVIPVWSETLGELKYSRSVDVVVPPRPLLKAFQNQPDMRPASLLRGHVLMSSVLGKGAVELMNLLGMLKEMSPQELESKWVNGLEEWWNSLPDEHEKRRKLLFQLWEAVAEIVSKEGWKDLNVPCIRSVSGEWHSVYETTYLNEALPTDKEPSGQEVREFLLPFVNNENRIDTKWITRLRQRRRQDPEYEKLSRIWDWISNKDRGINLQEILQTAVNQLESSDNPNWTVLVSIGQWAKHRNRPDLVTHVLVETGTPQQLALLNEALLADPYVEHGQDRRIIFSGFPVIAADYLEQDPDRSSKHEWRTFFEKAGAKGSLELRKITSWVSRYSPEVVTEFLGSGSYFGESNDSGYELFDYDIDPCLPSAESSSEQLKTVATWLEDGYRVLQGNGKREVSYSFRGPYKYLGKTASLWVKKLSDLPWVPCNDEKLRCPRDVLDQYDPARTDTPYAKLSIELIDELKEEGIRFGADIPEATPLQQLLNNGANLNSAELALILSNCRDIEMTDGDQRKFAEVVKEFAFPTIDNDRVEVDRIVKKVKSRGPLGGWIVPLSKFEERLRKELEHDQFPHEFPDTTTGKQALDYILNVWERSRSAPIGLANEVRNILPVAYAYLLQDISEDDGLADHWQRIKHVARVFDGREWMTLTDSSNIYFDDIEDRRFIPKEIRYSTVTSGHLGQSRREQERTAKALELPVLSSKVNMEWTGFDDSTQVSSEWNSRFKLILQLLENVRGNESDYRNTTGVSTDAEIRVMRAKNLALKVSIDKSHAERVPVNARLFENTLTIAGYPVQFGADAAKELLRHYSFGQRAALAADLAGMLATIENINFNLAIEKFQLSHAPDFELPMQFTCGSNSETEKPDGINKIEGESAEGEESSNEKEADSASAGEEKDQDPIGGNYTKGQSLAKQNALARELKASLKGEIVREPEGKDEESTSKKKEEVENSLRDEEYRKIVVRYEKDEGRVPELGDPHQVGWDIRSFDSETKKVRLIEVKGRGRPWTNDEVVELSHAQVQKAFSEGDVWYLYVVERKENGGYKVLPIENPTCTAAKWILCGESWRMAADNIRDYDSLN